MDRIRPLVSEVPCWTSTRAPTVSSRSASQDTVAATSRTGAGGASVDSDQVAARHVDVGGQPQDHRLTGDRQLQRSVRGVDAHHVGVRAAGQHDDLVPDAHLAGGDLTGVAAVVGGQTRASATPRGPSCGGLRPHHLLHREPQLGERGQRGGVHRLQVAEHGRPVVPGHPRRPDRDVVALGRRHRDAVGVGHVEAAGQLRELGRDLGEPLLGVVDQVDLVDRQHDVRHPQQRGDGEVPAGLLDRRRCGRPPAARSRRRWTSR